MVSTDNRAKIDYEQAMYEAYQLASYSPDPSTQNGALLVHESGMVLAEAINEFPRGVQYTEERWERPLKYKIIEHAERNAIYKAARQGVRCDNSTLIVPWAACSDCARAIIQAGVSRLVRHKQASDRSPDFWLEEIVVADQMLKEAWVEIIEIDGKISPDNKLELRHSGQVWHP